MTHLDDEFAYAVLEAVKEIPAGKVASYGMIADLTGYPENSRLVGRVLRNAEWYGKYPCHRVVNHCGRLAPAFESQRELLEAEGVTFRDGDHVDMKFMWKKETE